MTQHPHLLVLTLILFIVSSLPAFNSHGFLTTPRSRNLVAYQDRIYYNSGPTDPQPEDCPNCLNRGGSLAQCGIISDRNYDLPRNALGGVMPINPQAVYKESSLINVTVTLTAHHKGHFVFSACPISNTTTIPTRACFEQHRLIFVKDLLYDAPADVNHPERAYVAPSTIASRVYPTEKDFKDAMLFSYTLQLPSDLIGELVLLQWYYVASNSGCIHDGYDVYPFPREWIASLDNENDGANDTRSAWEEKVSIGTGLNSCNEMLPEDGDGVPEQFWNCAEVRVRPRSIVSNTDDTAATATATAAKTEPNPQQRSKAILGYYASWQWYDRDKLASPENMDFTKVTRVNFAFFQTNEQGDIWGTDSWADPNILFGPYNWNPGENDTEYCSWDTPTAKVCKTHFYEKGLIYQVHAAGAEIYPSLGGWSLSDPFPVMAANEQSRLNFANKCIELVEEMNFDGIDIDWEYPGYEPHSGTAEDTESYNLLLQILREKLDGLGSQNNRFYGLTAALPCGPANINNIDIPTAAKYLTELNLMTYDFFGAWSPVTGTNAPLYHQNWGGEGVIDFSLDGCVKNWVAGGGSPSAINIGLPFYGRSFRMAKGLNETHWGNDKNNWFDDDGSPQYFNIIDKLPWMIQARDEVTKTHYAFFNTSSTGGLVSYDDEEAICDKTQYCLDHDLHGFIIWELSGDMMRDLSTPLLDAVHRKLDDRNLNCKETFGFDSPSFSGYGIGAIGSEQAVSASDEPVPAPPTLSPTIPLRCPDGYTGSRPYNVCRSFFTCVFGDPIYPTLACPDGTLFDEQSSLCLPSTSVDCSLTASPTVTPSQMPTTAPSIYIEPDNSRGSITGIASVPKIIVSPLPTRKPVTKTSTPVFYVLKEPQQLIVSSIPSQKGTTSPVFNVFLPDDDSPEEIHDSSSSSVSLNSMNNSVVDQADQIEGSTFCPNNFSGAQPHNYCTEYYYCLEGVPNFPTVKCPSGTWFIEPQTFDLLISCKARSRGKCSIKSYEETLEEPEYKPVILSPGSDNEEGNNTQENMPTNVETVLDANQHVSPCKACPDGFTGYHASATDCVTYCLCKDGLLSEVLYACPSDWLFDHEEGRCLPAEQAACSSEQLSETSQEEDEEEIIFIPLVKDEGMLDEEAQDKNEDQNPKHEQPSFSLDDPFLTLEIKLSDDTDAIGWSVISSDGRLNVVKPPGTYSSYEASTTIYEAVPVDVGSKRKTKMSPNPRPRRQLSVTISNTYGNGLSSGMKKGHYIIYNGNPNVSNIIISGGEFTYYDVTLLVLTFGGILVESSTYFSSFNEDVSNITVTDSEMDTKPDDQDINRRHPGNRNTYYSEELIGFSH